MGKRTPVMTQSNMLADKLLLVADAEECRDSLRQFVSSAWSNVDPSPFVGGWCIDAICDHLTALTTGQIRFLLINIPPRHSKSTICSVLWPVWSWLHKPDDRFLCASYSLNLAIRDNLKKRNLIESKWFQDRYGKKVKIADDGKIIEMLRGKEFILSPQQNAKRFFMNDELGYQLAVSVGSTTTGEGGSVLSIDDAHSASEAHSDADRESAITWFREVWSNRMNDASKDRMLAIGQRIHENDVSGVILRERPDWVHLNLPAEYEPSRHCVTSIGWSDPRREAGDLLWPERFNQATLDRYKRDLGVSGFAAQYQQTPSPSGGGQFKEKWFRYCSIEGDQYALQTPQGIRHVAVNDCWRFTVVDLAISTKQSADWTVIQTYDVTTQNELLLIDQIRGHFDNPEQQRLIRTTYFRLKPQFIQIESVAYQLALIQQLRDEPVEAGGMVPSPIQVGDFLVRTGSMAVLDQTLRSLPGITAFAVKDEQGNYAMHGGCGVVRVQGDIYFFRFACEKQGYCTIVNSVFPEDIKRIEQQARQKYSIPIREYKPVRDKVSRASAPALLMENGKFFFLETLPDMHLIKTEYLQFPKGTNDDMVDCGGQAAEIIFVPRGPVMWSLDDSPEERSLERAPSTGGPVPSLFEDIDDGEMFDMEVSDRW